MPLLTAERTVEGERFTWTPAVSCVGRSDWHALLEASLDSEDAQSPERGMVEIAFPAELAWYLSAQREFVELVGEVFPPWPVGCVFVLKDEGNLFQVRLDPTAYFRLFRAKNGVTAALTLRDRSACGLRLWGEDKFARSPLRHTVRILMSRLGQLSDAVWAEPFPAAARSIISLTDHADWDSVPKATALCHLFAENHLRITKGVFPAADPGWDYGPGLDSPEYAAVIDRWFEAGHEIAYHGLGSGIEPPQSLDECLRRISILDPYEPSTWIDHSCGDYTFVRSGRLPGGGDLVRILIAKGVRNLWSYADVWQNPATDLRMWHRRAQSEAFGDFYRLVRRRGVMGPLQLAYLGSVPIKNLTGDAQYRRVMRRPWSPSEWKGLSTNYRLLRELGRHPLCLYRPSGDFFLQDPGGVMIFDTMLLNHVTLQLSPPNIEKLARDNGVLIAHTYLGADHKKGGRNCFKTDRVAEFVDGFRDNIEYISALQKRGQVACLPLRDLREALIRHATSTIVRTTEGWEVHGEVVVGSHKPYRIDGKTMARDHHGVFAASVSGSAFLVNPR